MSSRRRRRATNHELNAVVPTSSHVPPSTQWHHAHGRPTRKDKAARQQYLTPQEEKALSYELLRMARNGHPLRVKFLPTFAKLIASQRSSTLQNLTMNQDIHPPSKNWPQGFYTRHPEIKPKRLKALDLRRHGPNIYEKVVHWFSIIEKELQNPNVLADNVYNMNETGCQLSAPVSVKVLVSKDDLTNSRGAGIKRTLITAVECISATGRSLPSLIVWPAITHRSSWITHPTPDWHFAVSPSGYVDTEISLYWMRNVFHPSTCAHANGKPRVLINDGFATHESLELLEFCFENNIVLCRLPSHTSHKLQPCDVDVFGPLKAAYREQVDDLYRGGANTVGKEHFTLLYSRARDKAFTSRNIRLGWSRAGLFPFNPDKVLHDIPQPQDEQGHLQGYIQPPLRSPIELLITPVTSNGVASLYKRIGQGSHIINNTGRQQVEKLKHVAQRAIASRDLLSVKNDMLIKQNNKKKVRKSVKSTVVGTAKVMSYHDLMKARKQRDAIEAERASRSRGIGKKARAAPRPSQRKRSRLGEAEIGTREIETMGLGDYCSVMQF